MSNSAQPEAKPQRSTTPASLLSQWWTLGTITADRRTTGRHAKVAWVIIDRFRQDFGNGRASVRYIARACDLSASVVSKACRELVEWGYFSQNIGTGTRPTEFTPNWSTVPPMSNAKAGDISVLQGSNACVPQGSDTSGDSVAPVSHESCLPYPADKAGLRVSRNQFEAAPLAPLTDGLPATVAETASERFEEFWTVYPRKHNRAKAKVAYLKLDPGAELHAKILIAAQRDADHYALHGVDMRWVKEPANWINGECWLEDEPIIHEGAKGAAIAKAKANAKPASTEPEPHLHSAGVAMVGEVNPFSPFGTFKAEIYEAGVSQRDTYTKRLTLKMNLGNGSDTYHRFDIECADLKEQERGQAMLTSITNALQIDGGLEDPEELLLRPMACTIGPADGGIFITYAPLPANDYTRERAA